MASLTESISVINSAVRTLVAVVAVGAVGVGGWFGYSQYNASEIEAQKTAEALAAARSELEQKDVLLVKKDEQIELQDEEITTLNVKVEELDAEIQQLDTALRLLKINHRVARITVKDQTSDAETGETVTQVQFQELNGQGEPIDEPRTFRLKGDMVYIDSWVVKFDDKYVEQADIDRSTSLVLFRRIFGEYQEPKDGFVLDQVGARPTVYGRGNKVSDLEKQIWDDFWNVANDESMQDRLGIRAAHGDAPSIKVQKGKAYRVELRASDGLSIMPEGDVALTPPKPTA